MDNKCKYCGKEEQPRAWPTDDCCHDCSENVFLWECVNSFGDWEVRRKDRTLETTDKKYFIMRRNAEENARLLCEMLNTHHVT